jgi:hypothetical protein
MAFTNWQSRETQDENKQKQIHNTIYVGHHYTQTNANKTWALLQTTGGKVRTEHRFYAVIVMGIRKYLSINYITILFPRDVQHYLLHHYIIIRVITKLPNSKQSYKGKVKTHIHVYLVMLNISSTVDKSIVI